MDLQAASGKAHSQFPSQGETGRWASLPVLSALHPEETAVESSHTLADIRLLCLL